MHIEELVLKNFKSFGRTTRIPLYEDFTTISGPNGSGKSNIIDAVLFALGLARTRGMRAEKLTDLIYNPSHATDDEAGGPREASVEVVLANEDGTLSAQQIASAMGVDAADVGDADTITIRRRVKRTDDNYYSYYYLNGRSVNLSDIQDLLSQAGVAPEGYNVVMQGDVTGIINMTPGERREIIDEIAGVAEFDAKKEDAREELETVEERIDEADLRIENKRDRLVQLSDERETALEYRDLKEEREEYEGYRKAAELADRRDDLEETKGKAERRREKLVDLQEELDTRRGRVERLEEELADLNDEIERKGEDEQLAIKREMEEIKGDISRFEDKVESAEEKIEAAKAERREAFVEIDRKEEKIDELDDEIRETKVEKASIQSDIADKEAELEEVEAEIDAVDTAFDELKADLASKKEALEDARERRNELERERDRLLDEARRRADDIEETEADLDAARDRIPEIDAELDDLETELDKARANVEQIEGVVADLREEKQRLQSDLDDVEDDLNEAQQEYAELEASGGDDSSYGRAVSAIRNADLQGVHGPVAELGGVAERYALACETAAGGRMANVVVADDGVGQRCIDYLKQRNAGRATFLPMTEMQDRRLPSLPNHEGVVDFAFELVDFDAQYSGIFSYVLGDTLIVEDMATARDLMGDWRMVTLDGELVEKSGAMTGGSRSGSRYSFSGDGGRLERVADRITKLEDERRDLREEIRDVETRLDDARDRQTDAAEQVRAIEADIEAREQEREDVEAEIEALESDLTDLREDRAAVDDDITEQEEEIDAVAEEIATLEDEVAELESELADSRVPELTERKEEIEADIDELEARAADLDSDLNELQLERSYAEDAIEERNADIEAAQNRVAEQEERIAEFEAEIEAKEAELEAKEEAVAELEDELADLKAEREDLKETLSAARAARDSKEEEVNRAESRVESLEAQVDSLETEIAELEETVEADPEDVPDLDEVEERIQTLTAEMEALEPVNMLAIEEYEEVEAALADLEDKRETLVDERDGIEERIESYEDQKRETFMDAYRAIDAQFRDIFERLSNGTGELHLEDEDDPFEGGLTMRAQPGDKPIQRLDAMSGGEKSLTALAFIFALQRHNPAPFYALDEIDAFLDAANAERVGEMVDELAGEAQFVVVSHRSAMLERSERAIGVTMQENNVSAVTGIDLGGGADPEVEADD
ncbi:MAG: chromosome segregation protein SMC [Halobacteriaceae archaeon]